MRYKVRHNMVVTPLLDTPSPAHREPVLGRRQADVPGTRAISAHYQYVCWQRSAPRTTHTDTHTVLPQKAASLLALTPREPPTYTLERYRMVAVQRGSA